MNAKELQQLGIVSQILAGQKAQTYRHNAFRPGEINSQGLEWLIGPKTNGYRRTNKPTNANNLTRRLAEQREKNEMLVIKVQELLMKNDAKKNPKKSRSPVKQSVGKHSQPPSRSRKPPRGRVRGNVWVLSLK